MPGGGSSRRPHGWNVSAWPGAPIGHPRETGSPPARPPWLPWMVGPSAWWARSRGVLRHARPPLLGQLLHVAAPEAAVAGREHAGGDDALGGVAAERGSGDAEDRGG